MSRENEGRWAKAAADQLKGRTIVEVRYQTDDEIEGMGWYRKAAVLILDDGHAIWASADDEGNDAGALFTTNDALGVIPVISA